MTPGRYILSRDTFSVGGDYTVVDHAGATVLTFDGKLRFAATFAVLAPDGRELFTGKEHVFSLDRRFEFERDGVPYATVLREMTSDPGQILGSASYRYVVTLSSPLSAEAWRERSSACCRPSRMLANSPASAPTAASVWLREMPTWSCQRASAACATCCRLAR